jgi:hypothetical protein
VEDGHGHLRVGCPGTEALRRQRAVCGLNPPTATIRESHEFGTCDRAGAADRDPRG